MTKRDKIAAILLESPSLGIKEIAELCSCSESNISYHLSEMGLERGQKGKRFRLTEDQIKSIGESYKNGDSIDKISKDTRLSATSVKRVLNKSKIRTRKIRSEATRFKYDENFFQEIDSEEKAYFLGLMYADGSISSDGNKIAICLHENDCDIIQKLSDLLFKNKTPVSRVKFGKFKGCKVYITSKKMKEDLVRHGCTPRKSMTISLPKIDGKMMHHFIRGYFDGDGCFSSSPGRRGGKNIRGVIKIVSNTNFCLQMKNYLHDRLDIYMGVYKPSKNPQVGALQTGNDETMKSMYEFMYSDATICLERKRLKMKKYLILKNKITS